MTILLAVLYFLASIGTLMLSFVGISLFVTSIRECKQRIPHGGDTDPRLYLKAFLVRSIFSFLLITAGAILFTSVWLTRI